MIFNMIFQIQTIPARTFGNGSTQIRSLWQRTTDRIFKGNIQGQVGDKIRHQHISPSVTENNDCFKYETEQRISARNALHHSTFKPLGPEIYKLKDGKNKNCLRAPPRSQTDYLSSQILLVFYQFLMLTLFFYFS